MIYLINEIQDTILGKVTRTINVSNNENEAIIFLNAYINSGKAKGNVVIEKVQL